MCIKPSYFLVFICFLFACGQEKDSTQQSYGHLSAEAMESKVESEGAAYVEEKTSYERARKNQFKSALTGSQKNIDSTRQLVRQARLRFKVENSLDAALKVEQIAENNGGFVLENDYHRANQHKEYRKISSDTMEIKRWFEAQSSLRIRVPYQALDSTLRQIGQLALFLDKRDIQVTDVGFDWMEQHLALLRSQIYDDEITKDINNKGEKLQDISAARERAFHAKTAEDIAKIEQLRIADQVKFSTIKVDIYQTETYVLEYEGYAETETEWQPNVFARIWESMFYGFHLLGEILVAAAKLWPIIAALAALLFWKRRRKD